MKLKNRAAEAGGVAADLLVVPQVELEHHAAKAGGVSDFFHSLGSGWILQILSTSSHGKRAPNPTNGSWWIVQIFSTGRRRLQEHEQSVSHVVEVR